MNNSISSSKIINDIVLFTSTTAFIHKTWVGGHYVIMI